jgi:hydroxymethylpyrimidine pyrophosphatase-like HAD family hydrolase
MANLETCARELGTNGPIIAENGGQIKLSPDGPILNFGHQEKALRAMQQLKRRFGRAVSGGDWNKTRATDLIIRCKGVSTKQLLEHILDADLIETNYADEDGGVYHLVEKGINKGTALVSILQGMEHINFSLENTLVIGDGLNDVSMFQLFPHNILIVNEGQPRNKKRLLLKHVRYLSRSPGGEGFAEIANHITNLRIKAG